MLWNSFIWSSKLAKAKTAAEKVKLKLKSEESIVSNQEKGRGRSTLGIAAAAAAAKSLHSCPTLCDPIDGSPPGSAIPGILQARTLEWLPFPSPMHESEK